MADDTPTSRTRRLASAAKLGGRLAWSKLTGSASNREAIDLEMATIAAETLGQMRGLAAKAGQMFSYVDGLVAEPSSPIYEKVLGTLRAAAEGTQGWLAVDGEACLLTVQLGDELAFARHFTLPPLQMPKSEVVDLDAEAALPAWHERIGNQVARSLDLFERQSGLPPVLQMTVAPHGQAAAIARAIAAATGIDTDVFDPAAQFELMPGLDRERRPRAAPLADCMLALGAGLRSEAPPHPTASTASARVDADALPA